MTTRKPGAVKGRPVGALGQHTSQQRHRDDRIAHQDTIDVSARLRRVEEVLQAALSLRDEVMRLDRRVTILERG